MSAGVAAIAAITWLRCSGGSADRSWPMLSVRSSAPSRADSEAALAGSPSAITVPRPLPSASRKLGSPSWYGPAFWAIARTKDAWPALTAPGADGSASTRPRKSVSASRRVPEP